MPKQLPHYDRYPRFWFFRLLRAIWKEKRRG
jgi:hypothetical protein